MSGKITNKEYLRRQRPQVLLLFEAQIVSDGIFALRDVVAPCEKAKTDFTNFTTVLYPEKDESRASLGSIVTYEGKRGQRSVYLVGAQALHGKEIDDPRDTTKKLQIATPDMPLGIALIGKEVGAHATLQAMGRIAILDIDQSYRPDQSPIETIVTTEEPVQANSHLAAA